MHQRQGTQELTSEQPLNPSTKLNDEGCTKWRSGQGGVWERSCRAAALTRHQQHGECVASSWDPGSRGHDMLAPGLSKPPRWMLHRAVMRDG